MRQTFILKPIIPHEICCKIGYGKMYNNHNVITLSSYYTALKSKLTLCLCQLKTR